ncbi:MAG: D-alanine--D-alanine ligase [Bacteroidetes bacterium]|nr:MAG: D-alanine--D-alanine ligase [Bacteroidota bacterium]
MKKNIALVTGGYSTEAQISYKSAETVLKNLDSSLFSVYYIDISKAGWFYVAPSGEKWPVNKADFTVQTNDAHLVFDAAFMCIHGTPGEDGKLQGYFEMIGLPYTSCDTATAALTFNKRYTVATAAFAGVHVAKSLHLFKNLPYQLSAITAALQLPVFVKPNNGGSSLGMSKVNHANVLEAAIAKAFAEDSQVLIEEFIAGREFTIGVYRNKGVVTTLPITEVITKNEWFDFEAKYKGLSEEITPAVLTDEQAQKIRAAASLVFETLNCKGVVRIDFIYNKETDAPYMLEVNTVPGQSAASIIPQQVKAAGGNLTDFYTQILLEAFNA